MIQLLCISFVHSEEMYFILIKLDCSYVIFTFLWGKHNTAIAGVGKVYISKKCLPWFESTISKNTVLKIMHKINYKYVELFLPGQWLEVLFDMGIFFSIGIDTKHQMLAEEKNTEED